MTLGEYPDQVDPRFRLDLSRFFHSEFDIGRFRDVGHLVGVNRFNQAGGAIMEDFDNDGLLDLAVTSFDPTQPMSYLPQQGRCDLRGSFARGRCHRPTGGLVCYQADYDNDGLMDIFIPRGAWLPLPIRPTLLRNNGNGGFTDVTKEAGLARPGQFQRGGLGRLRQRRLARPVRRLRETDATVSITTRATARSRKSPPGRACRESRPGFCKGCTWIDYDNDGFPDLFRQ